MVVVSAPDGSFITVDELSYDMKTCVEGVKQLLHLF
ncbi:hypothetical protein MCP1_30004 [Candidatus Terasakiella magnetica]|nr:hypothetical protein MCP1_30004 [Candidatus Terasakiella magnetica]